MPAPLQIIPENAFDTSLPPPQYSADFASIVGNAASDTDGFETIFSTLAGHLADAPNFLVGLDSIVEGLGGASDPAGIPFEQDFSDSLASTISAGQGDFDSFAVHLTGNNPPSSSGGGGGGGTGPDACASGTIDFGTVLPTALPCAVPFTFTNRLTVPDKITRVDVSGDTAHAFSVQVPIGAQIPAGGTVSVTVTLNKVPLGTYKGMLTITTLNGQPLTGCLAVVVDPSGVACNQIFANPVEQPGEPLPVLPRT